MRRDGRLAAVTELRVVVPDEVAARLAQEASERGTSAEDVVSELVVAHVPAPDRRRPSFIGALRSDRSDLSERVKEILRTELPL